MSRATAVRVATGPSRTPPGPPEGRSGRDGQASRARSGAYDLPAQAGGPSPPRPILIAAGVLAVLTIVGAGLARLTGAGHIEPPASPVAVTRQLWFDDAPRGDVVVRTRNAAGADSVVTTLHAGEGMFVRGTLRALARGRRIDAAPAVLHDVPVAHAPFQLTRYADGRLTLDDSTTRAHLELRAFGPTNAAAFARLLPEPSTATR